MVWRIAFRCHVINEKKKIKSASMNCTTNIRHDLTFGGAVIDLYKFCGIKVFYIERLKQILLHK